MKKFLLMTAAVLITACQGGIGGDEEALEVAERWGEAWFNCDYHDAADYCTPESEQWLRMAASNTTDEELQLLRDTESGAQADADDYFTIANDTLRIVTLHVSHALPRFGLPRPPHSSCHPHAFCGAHSLPHLQE